ncbi:hypothetical protein FRB96_004620 [Tulasnella sp. 330]|nr:hypothetical protein FRB96_004620 [Tulasnella sp. 330]
MAKPLNTGEAVESQITGSDTLGGMQVELTPSFDMHFSASMSQKSRQLNSLDTSVSADLVVGQKVTLEGELTIEKYVECLTLGYLMTILGRSVSCDLSTPVMGLNVVRSDQLFIKALTRRTIILKPDIADTIESVKLKIQDKEGTPPNQQRLVYAGKQLDARKTLAECGVTNESYIHLVLSWRGGGLMDKMLGLGAGGKIEQKIQNSNATLIESFPLEGYNDPRIWDLESSTLINIQILNSLDFEHVTGYRVPPTPITPEMYRTRGVPWFELYDDHLETADTTAGQEVFKRLKSAGDDEVRSKRDLCGLIITSHASTSARLGPAFGSR